MYSFDPLLAGVETPPAGEFYTYTLDAGFRLAHLIDGIQLERRLNAQAGTAVPEHPAVVGRVGIADAEQVDQALAGASEAARVWASWPVQERLRIMPRFLAALQDRRKEFIEILVAEGMPRAAGDWALSGIEAQASQETVDDLLSQMWRRSDRDGVARVVRQYPDGVVALCPPQNAAGPLAAAASAIVAAGNAVVVRAPRSSALSTMWLMREILAPVLADFGAPAGVLSAMTAAPQATLDQFVESPLVNDVVYFGSVARGQWVERECVKRGKKPLMELAGRDGVLVWEDAHVARAAHVVQEACLAGGQICMLPNYTLVHEDVWDEFTEAAVAEFEAVRPGYADEDTILAPVVAAGKIDQFTQVIAESVQAGAQVLTGGRRLDVDGSENPHGLFAEPTLLAVEGLENIDGVTALDDELFFPLHPLVKLTRAFEGETDQQMLQRAVAYMTSNAHGLRNSLHAQDQTVIADWLDGMGNGGLLVVNQGRHTAMESIVPVTGGTGLSSGAWGQGHSWPLATTSRQGIIANTNDLDGSAA